MKTNEIVRHHDKFEELAIAYLFVSYCDLLTWLLFNYPRETQQIGLQSLLSFQGVITCGEATCSLYFSRQCV